MVSAFDNCCSVKSRIDSQISYLTKTKKTLSVIKSINCNPQLCLPQKWLKLLSRALIRYDGHSIIVSVVECASPASLFHDRQPLCNSLSSPPKLGSKTSTFTYSFKPTLLPSQPKTSLQITHVSLQDPIPQETQNLNPSKGNDSQYPDGKSGSSSKNYI